MQQFENVDDPPLPNLSFSFYPYKERLSLWFLIFLLDNCVLPLILYYALLYGAHAKPWLVCTIITCVWGFILYVEYLVRLWKFTRRWSTSQPLISSNAASLESRNHPNGCALSDVLPDGNPLVRQPNAVSAPSRWYCDASHWLFSVTLTITLAELITATAPNNPYIRVLAMVNPSMFLSIFVFIFLLDMACFMHLRAPFRISSIAKGEFIRPGLYTILEDVLAVDFNLGYNFRTTFNARWAASPVFRRLLSQLSIFWSLPGLLVSAICIVVIFTTGDDTGFAVGWGLPYLWIVVWAAITRIVIGRGLDKEQQELLNRD